MRISRIKTFLILFIMLSSTQIALAQEPNTAVVQAILFYSPTCPHCHDVIEIHLPAIKDQYGSQLQLVGIDTSHQVGSQLYQDTIDALSIPQERLGVPTVVVGEVVLVGSAEIPEQLPALIENGLAEGGIGWPDIPGLEENVPNLPPKAGLEGSSLPSESPEGSGDELMTEVLPNDSEAPAEDSTGFALGWMVMAFMLLALIFAAVRLIKAPAGSPTDPLSAERLGSWLIPLLGLGGLGIALYLAYVEITHVAAVCGPVGECNIVQSSPYAQIVGIPIAILGVLFYLAVLGSWLLIRLSRTYKLKWAPTIFLIMTFLGVMFSIYLTALELFVINAVCAWCLGSAVITTVLLLITVSAITKPTTTGHPADIASQTA